jgi:hypothetical protein
VALWLRGAFSLIPFENEYHTCTIARFGFPDGPGLPPFSRLDERLFLPSGACRWEDGHSLDLVPSYVVPALLVCLAVSGAAVVATLVKLVRTRWRSSQGGG